eukprot:scaffold713_cov131-Cylindrotheca_fusiformis.AAC.1
MSPKRNIAILVVYLLASASHGFLYQSAPSLLSRQRSSAPTTTVQEPSYHNMAISGQEEDDDDDDDDDDYDDKDPPAWDADVDYEKELPASKARNPDPATPWNDLSISPDDIDLLPKLGIDLDVEPLSKEEAEELRQQARDIINKKFESGINDIERLRERMNREMKKSREAMNFASELNAQLRSEELRKKIDKLTGDFLDSTAPSRSSTKLAAAAARAMEGTGRGVEIGTWGTLDGRTVIAEGLLGSVEQNVKQQNQQEGGATLEENSELEGAVATVRENRIFLVADTKQDKMAKELVPALVEQLEKSKIPNLQIDIVSPTSTMPLGGNDAACVVFFCTSISQSSSLKGMLDRLLRKTLQAGGKLGSPPTQLVGISTLGTERTDKFPYSLQNLLGKLDQRRQIEEVLINTVKNRNSEPALDYTLIKMAESFKVGGGDLQLFPGDALDGSTSVQTAATVVAQAVAFQPFARNSTLCIAGSITASMHDIDFWDKAFMPLDGPEIWRSEDSIGDPAMFNQLVEYMREWAILLAETGKGLTTPVIAAESVPSRSAHLVASQAGVRLLFLPTKTGKNYLSREEEKQREQQGAATKVTVDSSRLKKEGGIDVVVEVTTDNHLRVRARRCNYADDSVIKELSEETILKRLEEAMNVWKQEHLP